RSRISSKYLRAITKTHETSKARNPAGFFVIIGYHKDATKRMIAVYTKVYPMRFVYINLGTPPIKSLE
ncbi:site-specific integrase, partial [Klebsiella quasipneumoniae subsp. similipneumoniae]